MYSSSSAAIPKTRDEIVCCVDAILGNGRSARCPRRVEWAVNYHFLQGARVFNAVDYTTGRVTINYKTSDNETMIRIEEALLHYQRELGLLVRLDVSPLVKRNKTTMNALRKAAFASFLLTRAVSGMPLDDIKQAAAETALAFGGGALAAWPRINRQGHLCGIIEVVMPWEIVPFPAEPKSIVDVRGLLRHRWVTYNSLKNTPQWAGQSPAPAADISAASSSASSASSASSWKVPNLKEADLDVSYVPYGSIIDDTDAIITYGSGVVGAGLSPTERLGGGSNETEDSTPYVHLKELWLFDEEHRVCFYAAVAGRVVLFSREYEDIDERPLCPLKEFRGHAAATYYGRPFLTSAISLNLTAEQMYGALFSIVNSYVWSSFLVLPEGAKVTNESLNRTGFPKVVRWADDPTLNAKGPMMVSIGQLGDFPGRVAGTAMQLIEKVTRSSDMFAGQAPGRVDSQPGMSYLTEMMSVPRAPMVSSIGNAFAHCWKVFLDAASAYYRSNAQLNEMFVDAAVVNDTMVGLSVTKDGSVKLDARTVPTSREVSVHVRSADPVPREQRKQEVLALAKEGLLTPADLAWKNDEEDLQLPISGADAVNQRRIAMYRNVIQFNDGVTRNPVEINKYDDHALQAAEVMRFMRTVEFSLASDDVQKAFEQRLQQHETYLGKFPEAFGTTPDEMADGLGQAAVGPQDPRLAQMMASASTGPAGGLPGPLRGM